MSSIRPTKSKMMEIFVVVIVARSSVCKRLPLDYRINSFKPLDYEEI